MRWMSKKYFMKQISDKYEIEVFNTLTFSLLAVSIFRYNISLPNWQALYREAVFNYLFLMSSTKRLSYSCKYHWTIKPDLGNSDLVLSALDKSQGFAEFPTGPFGVVDVLNRGIEQTVSGYELVERQTIRVPPAADSDPFEDPVTPAVRRQF